MILYIKAQWEENIIPNEHVHFWFIRGINTVYRTIQYLKNSIFLYCEIKFTAVAPRMQAWTKSAYTLKRALSRESLSANVLWGMSWVVCNSSFQSLICPGMWSSRSPRRFGLIWSSARMLSIVFSTSGTIWKFKKKMTWLFMTNPLVMLERCGKPLKNVLVGSVLTN